MLYFIIILLVIFNCTEINTGIQIDGRGDGLLELSMQGITKDDTCMKWDEIFAAVKNASEVEALQSKITRIENRMKQIYILSVVGVVSIVAWFCLQKLYEQQNQEVDDQEISDIR